MTREEAIKYIDGLHVVPCEQLEEFCEERNTAIDMAIEALSEPINCVECKHYYETEDDTNVHGHCKMDTAHKADAVSREDYEDIIKDYRKQYENMNNEIADLEAKLSADAEWIPCSERLPSESGDYLCTIPLDADETYTEVLTFHKGRFYEDDAEWGATFHDDVLAWMPLPKPYKGGDDE